MREKEKYKNRLALSTAIVMVLIIQLVVGCSTTDNEISTVHPVAVRVVSPQYRDISEQLTYIGSVHATNEMPVIAQVQGTVAQIPIDEGVAISKGDVLIALSVPDLEATVSKLEVEYTYWDQHLKEDMNLLKKSSISQEQVDISRKAFETSRASLSEVKAKLNKAREIALFDGKVLKHFVKVGQHVMPGQRLLLIGNNTFEILVEVVQEDISRGVVVGSPVTIMTNSGERIESNIASIAAATTGMGRTYTVRIPVPLAYRDSFRLGEALTVHFILNQKQQVLSVPKKAVLSRNNEQFIFLVRNDSAFITPVTLGVEQSGWVSSLFSWNGTDRVAVSNITNLFDSTVVYPVEDES